MPISASILIEEYFYLFHIVNIFISLQVAYKQMKQILHPL